MPMNRRRLGRRHQPYTPRSSPHPCRLSLTISSACVCCPKIAMDHDPRTGIFWQLDGNKTADSSSAWPAGVEDEEGQLPLHQACNQHGTGNPTAVALALLASFPDAATTKDCDGQLPIHIVCRNALIATPVRTQPSVGLACGLRASLGWAWDGPGMDLGWRTGAPRTSHTTPRAPAVDLPGSADSCAPASRPTALALPSVVYPSRARKHVGGAGAAEGAPSDGAGEGPGRLSPAPPRVRELELPCRGGAGHHRRVSGGGARA